jgi:DNA-binding XRE family transcriptional regulator
MFKAFESMPPPAKRSLSKLGAGIAAVRNEQGISKAMMARRALITRPTLARIEAGDPGVSIGMVAAVLAVLGFESHLGDVILSRSNRVLLKNG